MLLQHGRPGIHGTSIPDKHIMYGSGTLIYNPVEVAISFHRKTCLAVCVFGFAVLHVPFFFIWHYGIVCFIHKVLLWHRHKLITNYLMREIPHLSKTFEKKTVYLFCFASNSILYKRKIIVRTSKGPIMSSETCGKLWLKGMRPNAGASSLCHLKGRL